MSLPSELDIERALNYLSQTDGEYGVLKGAARAAEYKLRHARAVFMLDSEEKSIAGKEMAALASSQYAQAIEEYQNAVAAYETVSAKRQRAVLTIEVWRSLNANRRQG